MMMIHDLMEDSNNARYDRLDIYTSHQTLAPFADDELYLEFHRVLRAEAGFGGEPHTLATLDLLAMATGQMMQFMYEDGNWPSPTQ